MFPRFSMILLLFLFVLSSSNTSHAALSNNAEELVMLFRDVLSPLSQFPVQGTGYDDIESTFGPRYQNSIGDPYDWHRGIDFDAPLGTAIYPAFNGRLHKIDNTQYGGYQVWIEHDFPNPVTFHGVNFLHFYTFYGHMEDLNFVQNMNIGDNLDLNTQIGTVGTSGVLGNPPAPHLHFELRVGTQCSLEFQIQNPNSQCSIGFGFDPHVHPMLLFPEGVSNLSFNLPQNPLKSQNTVIEWFSEQTQPTMNRIEFELLSCDENSVSVSHILDFNERIGFNASSENELDTANQARPYIEAVQFTDNSQIYQMNVVIPAAFVQSRHGLKARLRVTDIWGIESSTEWDYEDASCVPPQPPEIIIQSSNPSPALQIFDPAISKIGVLQPNELGLLGEQLQWHITIRNTSNFTAHNIVVTDTLRPELQIDSITSSHGTVSINLQTVQITIPSLVAGEEVTVLINTTVLQSDILIDNMVCVLQHGITVECASSDIIPVRRIVQLPNTGESPWWRSLLLAFSLMSLLSLLLAYRRFTSNFQKP